MGDLPLDLGSVAAFERDSANARCRTPVDQARLYRDLSGRARTVYADAGDAAVVEALKTMTYAMLAAELGVTTAAINKAVSRHRVRRD